MFGHDDKSTGRRRFPARPKRHNGFKHHAAGFTLVELLVVISIIGMLVGLTMPAVMSAIESARRASCANNMRQIALATNQYETQLRQYPLNWGLTGGTGVLDANSPTVSTTPLAGTGGVSWLASLLPFLDSGPLYSMVALGTDPTIMPGQPGYSNSYGTPGLQTLGYSNSATGINNPAVLSTVVPTFLCPSDTQRGTIQGNQALNDSNGMLCATTNYKACAGSNWGSYSSSNPPISLSASYGTCGRNSGLTDGVDHGNGVICRGGVLSFASSAVSAYVLQTTNMDIRDGASNTILLGESVPAWCNWSFWYWFEGSTATCGIPLNYTSSTGSQPESYVNSWQASCGFMSRHKVGANFASCDGSVHYISNLIDFQVYQALATIDGNEAVTADGSTVAWP